MLSGDCIKPINYCVQQVFDDKVPKLENLVIDNKTTSALA